MDDKWAPKGFLCMAYGFRLAISSCGEYHIELHLALLRYAHTQGFTVASSSCHRVWKINRTARFTWNRPSEDHSQKYKVYE